LGNFATVFQTEIYAILQCACENIRRAYKNKRILILSDSQAALKALSGPKGTSELVAECLNALFALAGLNEVTLAWVPGHYGILGNEEADKLARQASAMPLPSPEPALGITTWSAREGPGLCANIIAPGEICQVTDMVSFLLVDRVRKELMTCLS
jgi:hypothetical protein